MSNFLISVIVPVYNRSNEIALTLNSLKAQTLDKSLFEVVIADDGSVENISDVLKNYSDLNITYCQQEDLGFRVAAVRNLGINAAKGDIILFNDNGLLLAPDVLKRHVERHNEKKNFVILGYMFGTNYNSDMDKVRDYLDSMTLNQAISKMKTEGGMGDGRDGYMQRFGEDLSAWYIPWLGLWGGHFSVRRDFIDEHNIRFDEEFTTWGGEDNDFGIQLCRSGGYYLLDKSIEVVHYPTPNRPNADIKSEDFQKHYKEVQDYIANKHKTEDVIIWQNIGSSTNDDEKRAEFLRTFKG